MSRYGKDEIAHPPGVGLDRFYITDNEQRIGLKPGIIAKTHSEKNADMIIAALEYYSNCYAPEMTPEVTNDKDRSLPD
ncbi:MAG: hypothetical protein AB7L09_21325 [Nitrospira sp.]